MRALVVLLVLAGGAEAASLHIDYSVSVRGFGVGAAEWRADLSGARYSARFSGGITGIARLFSDASTSARVSGAFIRTGPRPADYDRTWLEDGETETLAMRFASGAIVELRLDPPIPEPERYVPVTDAHKRDVVDPVSAFLWPPSDGLSAGACRRTLSLFDGKRRFDLALSFSRMEAFAARDGSYSGDAVVCTIRYRPISGHRPDDKNTQFMAAGGGMEVWLVETGTGHVLPARIRLGTRLGRVVLEARSIRAR